MSRSHHINQPQPVEKDSDRTDAQCREDQTSGSEGSGRLVGLNPDTPAGRPENGAPARPAHPEPREQPRLIDSGE